MSLPTTTTSSPSSSRSQSTSISASISPSSSSPLIITTPVVSPPATSTPSSGAGNGGNSGGGFGNPSIASSASLYRTSHTPPRLVPRNQDSQTLTVRPFNDIAVYTFLATLVLLLSVSAAIVVRSFLLRRRHRRMIEEAIRNGTWIPPAPSGRGGPRIDLSKKPKMWEAYLDLNNQNQLHQQHPSSLDERDWDSMNPVMAEYVTNESVIKKQQNPNTGAGAGVATGGEGSPDGSRNDGARLAGSPRRLMGGIARRVREALRPSPSGPTLPLAHPASNGAGNGTRQGSAVNLGANPVGQEVPMSELTPPEPSRVRVAVLIAMPRPHGSHSSSSSPSSSSPVSASAPTVPSRTSSSSSSASASTSASPSPQIPTNPPAYSEEEEELPHIEMGVAELVVSDTHQLSHLSSREEAHYEGKGKVRESIMSVTSL